ncbi:hypothetical protein MANES_12G087300v8 [Manihot esculenta]|uniref:Uncharacterized protein n=1 Tax=Manihot esculenta TaxID=3983 RepID=A0ACB7GQB7_MANES|nr:hypothetical protein MANES_12G087300v8 [Manihot esculenta]
MAGFEQQVKERAKELKIFFKKGVKIVGESCKKGWNKVKHMKRRRGGESLIQINKARALAYGRN